MKIKFNNISVLLNFDARLWKMCFFRFYKKGITGITFLNVFFLGLHIKIKKHKKLKKYEF